MASCEKCWRDAYRRELQNPMKNQAEHYHDLIQERKEKPCTPNQQAGSEYAETCPRCGQQTFHCCAKVCMRPECGYRGEEASDA